MKSSTVFLGVGVLAVIGAVVGFLPDAELDHGKEVYSMQKCALCHSVAGIGGNKSPLDGVGSKLKSEEIKKWIRTPKAMKADSTMKAYPNLPERDLDDLTAYLMTLK
ncbi:MAG: cytochrome c [Acidobacteria bacterium]|nr:cytochrome c [Acidobacteriota bacterium]